MYALGFIETKGLVGAIEAADAMLKSADVFLVEKNQVGSGLVTVTVAGEVSAVQASVEAAVSALGRVQGAQLVSKHIIARHYDELSRIIGTGSPVPAAMAEKSAAPEVKKQKSDAAVSVESAVEPVAEKVAEATEDVGLYKISQLKKMKINRVRQIARSLSEISLTPDEVKKAPKKTLIDAIIKVTRQIEE